MQYSKTLPNQKTKHIPGMLTATNYKCYCQLESAYFAVFHWFCLEGYKELKS